MQLANNQNPTPRAKHAARGRWLALLAVIGLVAAASLVVTACGSSGPVTILNTEKVERSIEQSSLAQRGDHAQASCPSGVHQKEGLEFSCTAVVKGVSTRFVVTELDGSGRVHYEAP